MRSSRRRVAWWLLIWSGVTLLFISQNVVAAKVTAQPVRWLRAGVFESLYWIPFALATPFFLAMASRYRFERATRRRDLIAHALGGAGFAVVQSIVALLLQTASLWVLLPRSDPRVEQLTAGAPHLFPYFALIALWKYVVIIGICSAVLYFRQTQEARLHAADLERQLSAAQLASLQSQLHPHFLFNALNSAAMLTRVDPARAHQVLVQLADLFRLTLESSHVLEVPLRTELDFLDRYLAIERVRFEDRLTVRFEIAPGTEELLVPSLILQPLVENALRHGLAPKPGPGTLVVRSVLRDGRLDLEVQDNGIGLAPAWRAGIGLGNVQERVNAANDGATPVILEPMKSSGLRARISLPARRA